MHVRNWSVLPGVAKIFSPRRDSDIDYSGRHFEDWRPTRPTTQQRPPYKRRRRGYSNSSGNSSEGGIGGRRASFDRDRNYSHR